MKAAHRNYPGRLYIVPGCGPKPIDPAYEDLVKFAESLGYKVYTIEFPFKNRNLVLGSERGFRECVERIIDQIKAPHSDVTILGFSIGATLAHEVATRLSLGKLILGSMSPVLNIDLLSYSTPKALKLFSPLQYLEMAGLRYGKLRAKSVSVLFGEREHVAVKKRCRMVAELNNAKPIEVPGANHEFDSEYLRSVRTTLARYGN